MESYRRNELPETVKRYKTYTNAFQEWLMKTAVQRGVENAAQIAEQAKKKKKGKKTYKISTEQQEILVDGIADTNEPLIDASGLRDLEDAIRSRKEVTKFHKLFKAEDTGHSFFNSVLENAQDKLTKLIALIPVRLKAQDLDDDASTFTVFFFNRDESEETDNAADDAAPEEAGRDKRQDTHKSTDTARESRRTDNPLSAQETELQRAFLVLCFLYELNRVREVVREVWMLYRQEALTVITAALVTDLVQSYIQQNVAALVEDLDSYDSEPRLPLPELVQKLYAKLSVSGAPPIVKSTSPEQSDMALRHLLCVDAISHLEAYLSPTPSIKDGKTLSPDGEPFPLSFLRHFDAVRQGKVKLPIWDKFTEAMARRTKTHDVYLPFGLQIVLDVHEITQEDYSKIFKDITEHGFDVAHLIRTHIDYDDYMWKIDKKPDYMTLSDMKFSNVYLSSLDTLLKWIQELLKTDDKSKKGTGMMTGVFVTMHATMAGLSMWTFQKTYHGFSIARVKWFVTTLAHLYNAAIAVGGLDYDWPDLDYIINMHGPERLFVGGPSGGPQDFLERFYLSTCISSRVMAKDYKHTGNFVPTLPTELKKKRGLIPHFPLEDTIVKYYGPDEKGDRWLRRHAVFSCLHQLANDDPEELNISDDKLSTQKLRELQDAFSSMAAKIAPSKPKNRRKKPARVTAPNFAETENTYATLFRIMQTELQNHELHSNFDYLSFYRRAHNLILQVRSQVLFDNTSQLARQGNTHMDQNPNNTVLLSELFRGLKIKPKDKKVETNGDDVSTDVVPLDQLKRITKILEVVICKEGSVELDRAKMRLARDWSGIRADYIKVYNSGLQEHHPPVRDEQSATDTYLPPEREEGQSTEAEESAEGEDLPPGHWPDESASSSEDVHRRGESAEPGIPSAPASRPPARIIDIPTGMDPFTYDDLLGEFDSDLGSESEPDVHNRCDASSSEPILSLAEESLRQIKDTDVKALLKANKLIKKPFQAYVTDVADESFTSSASSQLQQPMVGQDAGVDDTIMLDDMQDAIAVHLAKDISESQKLEGHEPTANLSSKSPRIGNMTEVRSWEQDHAVRKTDISNTVQAEEEEDRAQQVQTDHECVALVQKPESELNTAEFGDRGTKRSILTDELNSTLCITPYDELYEDLPTYIPYITRPQQRSESSASESVSISKHPSHRSTSPKVRSRNRTITVTSAAGHLVFARSSKAHHHCLIAITRKQNLSLKCQVMCLLVRVMSGQKSRLQRRMHISTKVLLAKKVWSSADLQVAKTMISVSEASSTVGDEAWDSERRVD
jgi:hypothetical protein